MTAAIPSSHVLLRLALGIGAALLPGASLAHANLHAAGNADSLWIAHPLSEGEGFVVQHREINDPPGALRFAFDRKDVPPIDRLTLSDDRLWIVLEGGRIESVSGRRDAIGRWQFDRRLERSIPEGTTLQAVAAGRDFYALVRVDDAATLSRLDEQTAPQKAEDATDPVEDAPAPEVGEADAPAPSSTVPAYRLLRLRAAAWRQVPLPESWAGEGRSYLVRPAARDQSIRLVVAPPEGQRGPVVVYQRDAAEWTKKSFDVSTDDLSEVFSLDGQTILAQRTKAETLTVQFMVLRREGVGRPGSLTSSVAAAPQWAVTGVGRWLCLLTRDAKGKLEISRLDLTGQHSEAETLKIVQPNPWTQDPDQLLMVVAVVVALTVMFAFWRRDPQMMKLELPESLALADLGRRFVAMLIDLVPCVLLAMLVFGAEPQSFFGTWLQFGGDPSMILPRIVAIALFMLHTGLTELFTGSSLGKKLTGLRVVNLEGSDPTILQVLVRAIMKLFELLSWPLAMMPMISPLRQRLGDMVARTVVVAEVDPDKQPDPDEPSDEA